MRCARCGTGRPHLCWSCKQESDRSDDFPWPHFCSRCAQDLSDQGIILTDYEPWTTVFMGEPTLPPREVSPHHFEVEPDPHFPDHITQTITNEPFLQEDGTLIYIHTETLDVDEPVKIRQKRPKGMPRWQWAISQREES